MSRVNYKKEIVIILTENENNKYGIIYKITNIKNNKIYIGQTTAKRGFKDRYPTYGKGIERVFNYFEKSINWNIGINQHLYRSIKKYGFESFIVDEEFDIAHYKDDLNKKEKYWVHYYNSNDPSRGYNYKNGGDNGILEGKRKVERLSKISIPIYCYNTHQIFLSINDINTKLKIGKGGISDNLNNKSSYVKSRHGLIKFKYFNELNKNIKPMYCETTDEYFSGAAEIVNKYGLNSNNLCNFYRFSSKYKKSFWSDRLNKWLVFIRTIDYVKENYNKIMEEDMIDRIKQKIYITKY